jgi:membrane associated rhomboid family serine protease
MLRRARTYDPTAGVFPPAIKWLLIANAGAFVLQILFGMVVIRLFGLQPELVIERGWVWQPLTYMFIHGGFFHLLFNMFVLWMFGSEIERLWGSNEFLKYFILCGLGAAALSFVFSYNAVLIGASGAVYGVLLAFGILFPDRYIYLWFLLPIKAKYLVAGLAAIEFLSGIAQTGDGIAHFAHIGGMVTGLIYLKWTRSASHPFERLFARWRRRDLRVIEGGAGKRRERRGSALETEIDRILDKISAQGIESLTPEEERILEDASRRRSRD